MTSEYQRVEQGGERPRDFIRTLQMYTMFCCQGASVLAQAHTSSSCLYSEYATLATPGLLGLDLNCICKYACRKSGQLFNFTWTCSNVHGYLKWRHGNVKNTHPTLYEHSNIRTCLVSYNFLSLNSYTHCFRNKLHKEKRVLDYQTSDTYVKLPHTLATVQQRFTIITTHHKF